MIRNERQLAAMKAKRQRLAAMRDDLEEGTDRDIYRDMLGEVDRAIAEFESISGGHVRCFGVTGLDDVGDAIIRGRIANGWTQRELAARLGVSEQMVGKDEARGYENAGLARVADILDVLGFELVGEVRWKQPSRQPASGSTAATTFVVKLETPDIAPVRCYGGAMLVERPATEWFGVHFRSGISTGGASR